MEEDGQELSLLLVLWQQMIDISIDLENCHVVWNWGWLWCALVL
jgi:hypothetical protein